MPISHYCGDDPGEDFWFRDNERAQLGHDTLRGCLEPTEIFIQELLDESGIISESEWLSSV